MFRDDLNDSFFVDCESLCCEHSMGLMAEDRNLKVKDKHVIDEYDEVFKMQYDYVNLTRNLKATDKHVADEYDEVSKVWHDYAGFLFYMEKCAYDVIY